jgi:GWxTD domain-containing protein
MKKLSLTISLCFLTLLPALCLAQSGGMYYHVEIGHFFDRQSNPYVEVQVSVEGSSLLHNRSENGIWSSEVGLALEIKSKDTPEGPSAFTKTFVIAGPTLTDTSGKLNYNLVDVRRAQLMPGAYTLIGYLIDRNDPTHAENKFERDIFVDPISATSVTLTDVEFLKSLKPSTTESAISKHGYDLEPMITNGIFIDQDKLQAYAEVYNSDKFLENFYFASVYISKANSITGLDQFKRTLKMQATGLDLITATFDISKLPSETYYLNIDIYNLANEVVASTSGKFFVSNSRIQDQPVVASTEDWGFFGLSEDQLNTYIPTLAYISTQSELNFAKAATTFEQKKNYFYNFWAKRKESPEDHPAKAWKHYEALVKYSNEKFKAVYKQGWRTDRGRVTLMYGTPNDVETKMNENDRYPSEVWKYNRLGAQSNVSFIFYDPDGVTGEWPLLHSDKIGESPNPRWKLDIVRRNVHDANLDHDDLDGTNVHPFRD